MRVHSALTPWVAACAAWCAGCASTPDVDPAYRPAENVLEVVAVLRAHIADDTYRFEPARDFTGRNVYRSSLLRLENLESLHADAMRAGHMDGVIAFAKGRALERLRAYDVAAENYRLAAEISDDLKVEGLRSADVCDDLDRATRMSPEVDAEGDRDAAFIATRGEPNPDAVLAEFEARQALLDDVLTAVEATHHQVIVREEIERCDEERAHYFLGVRQTIANGDVRAVAELQRQVTRHPESKNFNRHMLELADLYADLAVEYVEANPPESLFFDPVHFQELIDGASRLYEMVAGRDGTPEKLEASRRLEAFLAFSIRIDRDRFTP